MSCSPFDLRDYVFGELVEAQHRQVDLHVRSCGGCREDLEQLRITHATLLSLRDEEVPQRIGFVSDKVFEPSWPRRVWQAFWASSPKLGFASAAMLSLALVMFTFFRPVAAVPASAPSLDAAQIEARVSQRVAAAIDTAVAASEARQARKTAEVLAATEQRFRKQRTSDLERVAEAYSYLQKQYSVLLHASYQGGGGQ
jgi:hypothetical protein